MLKRFFWVCAITTITITVFWANHCSQKTPQNNADNHPCVDAIVACGDRITDTTVGARKDRVSGHQYEKWLCWPNLDDLSSSGEKTYLLHIPPKYTEVTLSLKPHREKLAMAVMLGTPCFTDQTSPLNCDFYPFEDLDEFRPLLLKAPPRRTDDVFIVIEGKDGIEGSFDLDVQCRYREYEP